MTEEISVEAWIRFKRKVNDQAVAEKQSQAALFALFERYSALSQDAREVIDDLLVRDLESDSEMDRFDALAMIREFRITSALPNLRALADRLALADNPGAPYEWAKVNRLVALLVEGNEQGPG